MLSQRNQIFVQQYSSVHVSPPGGDGRHGAAVSEWWGSITP